MFKFAVEYWENAAFLIGHETVATEKLYLYTIYTRKWAHQWNEFALLGVQYNITTATYRHKCCCFAFLPVLTVCFALSRWCLPVSMWMQQYKPSNHHYNDNTYLLKVSVAPWFAISKNLGGDSAILVILHAYRHGASLDTCHMPSRGIGDIDTIQTTAWCPQSGPPSMVIVDP